MSLTQRTKLYLIALYIVLTNIIDKEQIHMYIVYALVICELQGIYRLSDTD